MRNEHATSATRANGTKKSLPAATRTTVTKCHTCVTRTFEKWRARQDSNLRPPA
jgi:hypothetical protein